jgi:hypothetical protein
MSYATWRRLRDGCTPVDWVSSGWTSREAGMICGLPLNSRAARRLAKQRQWMRDFLLSRARQLYVSYCEADMGWRRVFVAALRQAGADVWFDETHSGSG